MADSSTSVVGPVTVGVRGTRSPRKVQFWVEATTKAVNAWLRYEVGMVVTQRIKHFFASGYQFGVLFAKLGFQVDVSNFSQLQSDVATTHNFRFLKPQLAALRIQFNDHTLQRIMRRHEGAALWVLHQIMTDRVRTDSQRKDGQTVSDDAVAMMYNTPQPLPLDIHQYDDSVRLPAVRSPTNNSVGPANKNKKQPPTTSKWRPCCEQMKHNPLSKRHMARAMVRIMLHKLRTQNCAVDDQHGALPLDAKRLGIMHMLMQTLPAVTQALIHVQVGSNPNPNTDPNTDPILTLTRAGGTGFRVFPPWDIPPARAGDKDKSPEVERLEH